jgi:hypothetical protein
MAFGSVTGTFQGNNASIPASFAAALSTGSGVVSTGDLVVVVVCEQTGLTVSACTDNLGNTYTAQNAGTLSGTSVSGCLFWSVVTNAGTITSVTATCTSSTHNGVIIAAIIDGPFLASPVDANPANTTNDLTTPYTTPATGTLAQAQEVIVSWITQTGSNTLTATAPNVKIIQQNSVSVVGAVLGSQVVAATTTVTPAWTGTAPTANVLGTISFKAAPPMPEGWGDKSNTYASRIAMQTAAMAMAFATGFSTQAIGWAAPAAPIQNTIPGMAWYSDLARPLPPPKAQQATFFVPFNTPQVAASTPTLAWQQPLQIAPVTTAAIRNTTSLTFIVPPFPVPSGWQGQPSVAPTVAKAQQATIVLPFVLAPPVVTISYGWQQPLATPPNVAQAQPTQAVGFAVPATPSNTIAGMAWYRDLTSPLPLPKAQQAYSFVPLNTTQVVAFQPTLAWQQPLQVAPVGAKAQQATIIQPFTPSVTVSYGWQQPLAVTPASPKAQQATIVLPFVQRAPIPTTLDWQQPLSVAPAVAKALQASSFFPLDTPQITTTYIPIVQEYSIFAERPVYYKSYVDIFPPITAPANTTTYAWQQPLSIAPPVAQAQQTQAIGFAVPTSVTAALGPWGWQNLQSAVPPRLPPAQQAYSFVPLNTAQIVTTPPWGWQNLQSAVAPKLPSAQQAYSFVPLNTTQVVTPAFGWFGPLSVAPKVTVAIQPQVAFIGVPIPAAAIGGIPWFSPLMAVPPTIRLAPQAYSFVPLDTKQVAPPAVSAIDPFVHPDVWRKYKKRLREIEAARLAQERAEDRAKEVKRAFLRNMVLGVTEDAQEVLEAKQALSKPDGVVELANSLHAMSQAKTNRELEQIALRTRELIAAFHQYINEMQEEEDEILIISEIL